MMTMNGKVSKIIITIEKWWKLRCMDFLVRLNVGFDKARSKIIGGNVLKTGPMIELEKFSVHYFYMWSNFDRTSDIINT